MWPKLTACKTAWDLWDMYTVQGQAIILYTSERDK